MYSIINSINKITDSIGKAVSWLTLLLVILIGVDVVLRYLFNWNSSANQEMEWHLFAALFLLGAAYTLRHDKHVRVDVFYSQFSPTKQAWVNFIGTLIFLIPFCLVVFWTSLSFVSDAWMIKESSPEPGGLPARFVIKSAIPASAFLLFLQAVSILLYSLSRILNTKEL
ncbi:MAG: TRAP transporter small permease subunit [Reichenbachiella sp.]